MVVEGSLLMTIESERVNLSHNFQLGNLFDMEARAREG